VLRRVSLLFSFGVRDNVSTYLQVDATVRDVVGLYLHPPENAVVVRVHENSQCLALECGQPILAMRPGIPERQTHTYRALGRFVWFHRQPMRTPAG
jgi:hypothetical protein